MKKGKAVWDEPKPHPEGRDYEGCSEHYYMIVQLPAADAMLDPRLITLLAASATLAPVSKASATLFYNHQNPNTVER